MPRSTRYLQNGFIYHLTHRCHNGRFMLQFSKERDHYREWLRVGAQRYHVAVLGCAITSNHDCRERLLDRTGFSTMDEFVRFYMESVEQALAGGRSERQAWWTEAVAVGSEDFINDAAQACIYRRSMDKHAITIPARNLRGSFANRRLLTRWIRCEKMGAKP